MDSISSFIHLLDKIETQDRRLGMTIKNLRCLTGGKSMGLAYAMALKLAEESEKLTLLTRAKVGSASGCLCCSPKRRGAPPPIFGASCTRRSGTSFRAKHRFDTPKAS